MTDAACAALRCGASAVSRATLKDLSGPGASIFEAGGGRASAPNQSDSP